MPDARQGISVADERFLGSCAAAIARRRLAAPAVVLLECLKPVSSWVARSCTCWGRSWASRARPRIGIAWRGCSSGGRTSSVFSPTSRRRRRRRRDVRAPPPRATAPSSSPIAARPRPRPCSWCGGKALSPRRPRRIPDDGGVAGGGRPVRRAQCTRAAAGPDRPRFPGGRRCFADPGDGSGARRACVPEHEQCGRRPADGRRRPRAQHDGRERGEGGARRRRGRDRRRSAQRRREHQVARLEQLRRCRPDIVLLSGGTDGGAVTPVVALAELIAAADIHRLDG